jgi:hypothetical protein
MVPGAITDEVLDRLLDNLPYFFRESEVGVSATNIKDISFSARAGLINIPTNIFLPYRL